MLAGEILRIKTRNIGQGVVSGEYVVALPDGRVQTTRYEASPSLGYRAQVSYQPPHQAPHQAPQEAPDNGQAAKEQQKEKEAAAEEEVLPDSSLEAVIADKV